MPGPPAAPLTDAQIERSAARLCDGSIPIEDLLATLGELAGWTHDPRVRSVLLGALERVDGLGDPARSILLLALIRQGVGEATQTLTRMALGPTPSDRRAALACLIQLGPAIGGPLLLRMFDIESDASLMQVQIEALEGLLGESDIERVLDTRLDILTRGGPGADGAAANLAARKASLLEWLLSRLYERFRLLPDEVRATEERFQARARAVLRPTRPAPAAREDAGPGAQTAAGRSPRGGLVPALVRWRAPIVAGVLGVLLVAGVLELSAISKRLRGRGPAHVERIGRRVRPAPTSCLLGAPGERVHFEAEVLVADPRRGILVVLKDRAIGVWVTVAGPIDWPSIQPGVVVAVTGEITSVGDERSVTVEATEVVVAQARPGKE